MKTGTLRRVGAVAAVSGLVFALPSTPASADRGTQEDIAHCQTASGDASDLSPSTQKAWADFICGGAHLTGGAARMVSGAWIGAPGTILVGATGGEMSEAQFQAWKNWDRGANQAGKGAAMIVSGVYVGAPGYILDKLGSGATPADLTPQEMDQVSFMVPKDSQMFDKLGLGDLPIQELPTQELPQPTELLSVF